MKPAVRPKIEVTKFDEGGDLEFSMTVEVFPAVEPTDFTKIKLERETVDVDEKEIEESLRRIAESNRTSEPVAADRKSKSGDVVVIDFVGKIDGNAFPGGAAEGYKLELGSGDFVPGFEDRLIGAGKGDRVEVNVTFPEDYGAEDWPARRRFRRRCQGYRGNQAREISDELKSCKENLEDENRRPRGAWPPVQGIFPQQQRLLDELTPLTRSCRKG